MAKTTRECPRCGSTIKFYFAANRSDTERKADWMMSLGKVCDDCAAQDRATANATAAADNAIAGLPALTGSEKQIAWAETIRAAIIAQAEARLNESIAKAPADQLDEAEAVGAEAMAALRAEVKAAWWIDARILRTEEILKPLIIAATEAYERGLVNNNDHALAESVMAEATVRPETGEIIPTVTEIRVLQERIEAHLPEKNESFRALVKSLGYTWTDTCWARRIDSTAGPIADRAAELGNRLLAAGFPIRIQDHTIRAAAIAGQFAPEQRRWLKMFTSGEHVGKIAICWPRDEDLYAAAKALPGARYAKPHVAVPVDRYEALLDFADAYGFAVGPAAQAALATARGTHDAALLAHPAKAPKASSGPGPKPAATGEIADELRDDDTASEWMMLHGDSQS